MSSYPWTPSPVEESSSPRAPSVKSWTGSELASETASRSSTTRRSIGYAGSQNLSPNPSHREPQRDSYRERRRTSNESRGPPPRDFPSTSNTEDYLQEDLLGADEPDTSFGALPKSYSTPNSQRGTSQQWSPPPFSSEGMPPRDGVSMQGRRLVIAIDYGTTYTGMISLNHIQARANYIFRHRFRNTQWRSCGSG
jgi:hypothetical protein